MKRIIAVALAFLIAVTTPTLAPIAQESTPGVEQAKIVLVAPSTAKIGELVRLDVSGSVADSFKWLVVPDSVTDFLTYDAGARAVFSARTYGEYRFIVSCAKGGTVDVVTVVVKVASPLPPPTSGSFAGMIPFWMTELNLPSDQKLALADSFEKIAAREAELPTAEDWIKATAAANKEILGESLEVWAPMLDKIGGELLKMAQDGRLMTPEQHAQVWKDIAAGLRNS
jgi:hypothetical protein